MPALLALGALLIGVKHPRQGGLIELWLGGLGFLFGLVICVTTFNTLLSMGIVNQGLLISILAAGSLLLVSGMKLKKLEDNDEY